MVWIIKSNGEEAEFEPERLRKSLMNAGADLNIANEVLTKLRPKLHDGITTRKIYSLAFKLLKKVDLPSASRYEVKWAITRLGKGQQGFSFEQYAAKIFERMGYNVKTNQIVQGKSGITHEIDLIAVKDNEKLMIECKHHSRPGVWVDVQVALYVHARFLDLKPKFDKVCIFTNTRFSEQAETYAKSVGMQLIGWDYPQKNGLKVLVDKYAVYPITVLKTVNNMALGKLLSMNIITVSEINQASVEDLSRLLGKDLANKIKHEARLMVMENYK